MFMRFLLNALHYSGYWTGSYGAFPGQAFPHTLSFSSSLKCLDNSIWYTFACGTSGKELACRCKRSRRLRNIMGFPSDSDGEESASNAGDLGSVSGSGSSNGGGNGDPLQYSCLENSMDRGPWWTTIHGVTKTQTQLKGLSMPTFPELSCRCKKPPPYKMEDVNCLTPEPIASSLLEPKDWECEPLWHHPGASVLAR